MRISKRFPPVNRRPVPILHAVIVDDQVMTVRLAEHVFKEAGWKVSGFTSAHAALEALKGFEPDLIVTDFRMPEMSGPEFLLAAQKLHEGVPSLVMTAYDDEACVHGALRKAGVPAVNKIQGLTELLVRAEELVSVRRSLKAKYMTADRQA